MSQEGDVVPKTLSWGVCYPQGTCHPHVPTKDEISPTLMRFLYLWLSQKVDSGVFWVDGSMVRTLSIPPKALS